MPSRKTGETSHYTMHCILRQLSAHVTVSSISFSCSDHVGWINVLQSDVHSLILTVLGKLFLNDLTYVFGLYIAGQIFLSHRYLIIKDSLQVNLIVVPLLHLLQRPLQVALSLEVACKSTQGAQTRHRDRT
jgi:hypothetical protein